MNKTKLVVGAIIIGLGVTMLSACDDDVPAQTQYIPAPQQQVGEQYVNQQPPQVIQSAPAPVIVQSGSHDSGVGDFATGMILGHMLSGGSNRGSGYSNNSSRTTIINNNTVAQPRSSYSSNSRSSSYSTNKQVYQSQPRSMSTQTYSRPTMNTNSSYTTKKSYSSPLSSSRSYSSSSSRKSYSSSRRR